jgi:hypothetical protein
MTGEVMPIRCRLEENEALVALSFTQIACNGINEFRQPVTSRNFFTVLE